MEGSSGKSIGRMLRRLKMTETDEKLSVVDTAVESLKSFLLTIDYIQGGVVGSCKEKR